MRICFFLDERIEPEDEGSRFVVSSIVSERSLWDERADSATPIGAMRLSRRLDAIDNFLYGVPAAAIVGYANVPSGLALSGEVDGTRDVPRMSRLDNIWSIVFLSVITHGLGRICGATGGKVDMEIFHDPKSLTGSHREAVRTFLAHNLTAMASELPVKDPADEPRGEVCLSRFEEVPKPPSRATPTTLQRGTVLAHHLCTQSRSAIASTSLRVIGTVNLTEAVLEVFDRFAAAQN
jgi:hypothetical protein